MNDLWDVIVVGGGPAGMMAAGTAAEKGVKVVLIEKNKKLGRKLLLTGGGRCNFTNSEPDIRKLTEKFKKDGKFLFSSFSRYGVKETLDFFHGRGIKTKVEDDLRTFPVSDSAQTILDTLLKYMEEHGVVILSGSSVSGIVKEKGALVGVKLEDGRVIKGRSIILATGGTSHPETGSTGDGYRWLKDIGHKIAEPYPSLVSIVVKDAWVKKLAGISLNDIKITALQNGKRQIAVEGKILFTHMGVSGPTVLNMSGNIGEMLKHGEVMLAVDIFPGEDRASMNARLKEMFKKHDKKLLRNVLSDIVPAALSPIIADLSEIPGDITCNDITNEERMRLIGSLKGLSMRVDRLMGEESAIVAGGGVSPKEVDFKTMCSRLYPNLYLIGDILDIGRPSGGYSLQLCWTTGAIAGDSASAHNS